MQAGILVLLIPLWTLAVSTNAPHCCLVINPLLMRRDIWSWYHTLTRKMSFTDCQLWCVCALSYTSMIAYGTQRSNCWPKSSVFIHTLQHFVRTWSALWSASAYNITRKQCAHHASIWSNVCILLLNVSSNYLLFIPWTVHSVVCPAVLLHIVVFPCLGLVMKWPVLVYLCVCVGGCVWVLVWVGVER